MKTWKFVAGALLVLAGFSAGVGLTIFSVSSTVHGATGDPNPALKSVAHNATLAGDGTMTAPLGIANGGVSAPKLSTSATPSPGQVLGFNGANLAWRDAPVGGVRVVDKFGKEIGPFYGSNGALRTVGGFVFALFVSPGGFEISGDTFAFVHTTSDCSGPRYLEVTTYTMARTSQNSSRDLFYGADPIQQITVNSYESVPVTADPNQPGSCTKTGPSTNIAGLATKLDISNLGFVPPFHLEF